MKKQAIQEVEKIIKSVKKLDSLMDYKEVRKADDYYPFIRSMDELLIDLISYKQELQK